MKKVAKKKVARKSPGQASRQASLPKASTIRLQPELQAALNTISAHLDRPKNKLVNQAVAEFLEKTTYQLRNDLDETLQELNAYRRKDPNFAAAIEGVVVDEAAHAQGDAHEGEVETGSVQSLVSEIQALTHA